MGVCSTFWIEVALGGSGPPVPSTALVLGAVAPAARREPGQAFAPLALDMSAEASLRATHAGARELLAEDNRINEEVAVTLLTQAGLRVDVAHDGVEAVSRAARRDCALILMDMQMPLLDSPAAAERIRGVEDTARPPIVAMTAGAGVEDRDRCMAAGMDDFIAKPVDPPRFCATIERWLGPMGQPTASARLPPVSAEPANGRGTLAGLDVARGRAFLGGDDVVCRRALGQFCQCTHRGSVAIPRTHQPRTSLVPNACGVTCTRSQALAAVGGLALSRTAAALERNVGASGNDAPSSVDRLNADLREFVAAVQARL